MWRNAKNDLIWWMRWYETISEGIFVLTKVLPTCKMTCPLGISKSWVGRSIDTPSSVCKIWFDTAQHSTSKVASSNKCLLRPKKVMVLNIRMILLLCEGISDWSDIQVHNFIVAPLALYFACKLANKYMNTSFKSKISVQLVLYANCSW